MSKKQAPPGRASRQLQLPICEVSTKSLRAGMLCRREAVREAFDNALKKSPLCRGEITAEMSRLTGESITENHINNWCSEAKKEWRFPLEYAASFCAITQDYGLMDAALGGTGRWVGDDKAKKAAEYGRLMIQKKKLAAQERELLETLL